MKYEVIDNFLDEEYFGSLESLITNKHASYELKTTLPWFFQPNIAHPRDHEEWGTETENIFYMTHQYYEQNAPVSPFYDNLIPLLEKLETRCLMRVKGNLFPNTEILYEHPMHVDYDFPHSGALLSLNTCDGYTKLKDGTKIDSVANRILFFDPSEEHCSTNTTNVPERFNININYIKEQL